MCSSSLHDPIFPHVQFHREYALACLATCAVPTNMHDPILPHVQFQQEYELASLGSFTVDSLSRGGMESLFFLCSLHVNVFFNLFLSSLLHRSFSDVLYPSMISYLIYQNSKTRYLHAPHINLYLYYYFSYFIQVINHFASFLYSVLLI